MESERLSPRLRQELVTTLGQQRARLLQSCSALTDAERATHQVILTIRSRLDPIDVEIRSKTTPVHGHAKFLSKGRRGGIAENGNWSAVTEIAFAKSE